MPVPNELTLLLSEKDNADGRIASYLEVQTKILGIALSVVIAALGWLFVGKDDLGPAGTIYVLLVLVSVASISILQGTVFTGLALGFIHYKHNVLGARLQTLLALEENPLSAVTKIEESPAGPVVAFATWYLGLAHGLLGVLIFFGALGTVLRGEGFGEHTGHLTAAFGFSGFLLAGALVAMLRYVRALKQVRGE